MTHIGIGNHGKKAQPSAQDKKKTRSLRVCIAGLGYIGLPTAAVLAEAGYRVCGIDVESRVVDAVNRGKIHIVEPDLEEVVRSGVASGRLRAGFEPEPADVFMICVPTPFSRCSDAEVPTPNMEYVTAAARTIAPYLRDGNIVILESTSPVGTTEGVRDILQSEGVDTDRIYLAYCPERVLPGNILKELVENDRIVGCLDAESTQVVKEFYRTFVTGTVYTTDCRTAEMCKLVENSYRDVNIAFANELSILCDKYKINVREIIALANRHPRVDILQPGTGVGGHCIAVDPWFLVSANPGEARLIRTAREVNLYKTDWCIEKIKNEALRFELSEHRKPFIVCMGLTYKPNVDDLRESPALKIAKKLRSEDFLVAAVEPNLKTNGNLPLIDIEEAMKEGDIIVFLVAHRQFKGLKAEKKIVLDFCGL
jgi:UDP-N-acetyl-D-mannosaminuronic acid dehydrogenase